MEGIISGLLETRPHGLRRILVNLMDNAVTFAGAAELVVGRTDDGRVVLQVLDRGPGIANEHLPEVFKPFYRLENSRSRETGGTGLGLAIARQLAQGMEADLTLSAREGGGVRAELRLQ